MSYLVIARKWRPQTFEEVVGQHHVTRTLQNAVLSGRVAHAYLFTGARGVGKTSVARILARSLNCESGPSTTPCNACSNCREITQGNAVDVLEIDGASNRGIDNIRELKETVRYRPAKSRYKIYIIDEVHMLTTEAFNALLKTLEEPPEHVVFIFATTEPHKIPATILSRCQRFDFRRIPAELLLKQLKEISGREDVRLSDDVLFAIAREADGSMRDAQSLLEQLLAFSGEGLSDEEILDVLGVVDRRSVHKVGSAILAGDVQTCLEVVGDLYRRGIDSRRFCQQLCDHFRNLLVAVLDVDGRAPELRLPEEEDRFLREQAAKTTSESLYLYLQLLLKGEEDIRRSSTPRIALEMLLLRMTQMPALESIDALIGRISDLERRLEAKAAAVPSAGTRNPAPQAPAASPVVRGIEKAGNEVAEALPPRPADPVHEPVADCREDPPASIDPADMVQRWPGFLGRLEASNGILAAKLGQSRIAGVAGRTVELEVLEVFEDHFKDPAVLAELDTSACQYFGQSFEWVIRKSAPKGASENRQQGRRSRSNPKRSAMEHPAVLQALEILGGELVEIRRLKADRKGTGD